MCIHMCAMCIHRVYATECAYTCDGMCIHMCGVCIHTCHSIEVKIYRDIYLQTKIDGV